MTSSQARRQLWPMAGYFWPQNLFGVDARLDGLGLVPGLDGCRIIELSATGAVLDSPSGTRQSYQRKVEQPGRVLSGSLPNNLLCSMSNKP